ncbi:mucin-13 [Rattus norvegicus]|uniref:Mucin 13, cell surface associated n=1 Tax=Rattus norvegicus TaxID=10116 RepID=A0A096MIY5_RAT|nr:mucin-13 [Rattus norvegicus]
MVTNSTNSPTTGLTQSSGGASSPTTAPTKPTISSSQTSTTAPPPGGASSPTTAPTKPTTSSSQTSTTAPPPGGASSPTTAPTKPTTSSSQTSTTAPPPGGASSPTTAPTKPTGSSSQTSTTAPPPGGASSPTTAPTKPTTSSSQTSTTAPPPGGASSPTTAPTKPTTSSSQTSTTAPPPGGASSPTTVPTKPTGSSSQTSTAAPPPGGASSPATAPTKPTGSSSQTSTTAPPPGGASSPATAPTKPTGSSSQTSGATQPPGGASSPTVTSSSSTGSNDPCNSNPCKSPASCVKLYDSYFCLCLEGYYYNNSSSCVKGTTFPGEIGMSVTETADLEDKNSVNYQSLHSSVVNFFENTFKKTDYGQTVILKVSKDSLMSSRSVMRAATKTVYVSVVNMFGESTTEDEKSVASVIEEAVKTNSKVQSYSQQDRCDYYGCVKSGSNVCRNGLQCTCKPGLERLNPQVPFCVAPTCSEPCSAEKKQLCLKKDNGAMECGCMAGYRKANGKCEECPFGYSGMDCKDQFQLILTIVGTIAGAFILILLIVFIVSMRSKNKKKSGEEQNLIEDDFHNLRMRPTGFSNFGADTSIFPKVKTGVPSQTSNPYANHRSMPRPDY